MNCRAGKDANECRYYMRMHTRISTDSWSFGCLMMRVCMKIGRTLAYGFNAVWLSNLNPNHNERIMP